MFSACKPAGVSSLKAADSKAVDVNYSPFSGSNVFTLHLPDVKACGGQRPLVLTIHGGGFVNGDKDKLDGENFVAHFLRQCYLVANINYRLASKAAAIGQAYTSQPVAFDDASMVVKLFKYLKTNHETYIVKVGQKKGMLRELVPELAHRFNGKVAVVGLSAGGTIALHVGTLREQGNVPLVDAVIDVSGIVDFFQEGQEVLSQLSAKSKAVTFDGLVEESRRVTLSREFRKNKEIGDHPPTFDLRWLAYAFRPQKYEEAELLRIWKQASPLQNPSLKGYPPTLIIHGKKDDTVALWHGRELYRKLLAFNGESRRYRILLHNGGHDFSDGPAGDELSFSTCFRFLKENL